MTSSPGSDTVAPCDLRLRDVTLAEGRRATIDIRDGRVAVLHDPGAPLPPAARTIDLGGALVLPGLADGHVHLDKCLLGLAWRPHRAQGSVRAIIADEKAFRRTTRVPLAAQGAEALLERMLRGGTTSLRTHVDIDDVTRLDHLAQILDLRARWSDRMQIQIVAFPQSGILGCPPVAGDLDEALRMGADLVGGLDPVGIDGDRDGHLDIVFALAERHGRGIDIHLHDGGEAGLDTIAAIAARTAAAGLGGRVTISHAFALAEADDLQLGRIAEGLNRAGVAILSSVPGGRRCPPIPRLRDRGVPVCFGTDNVRDCWNPATVTGMVDRAQLAAYRFDLRTDGELAALLDPVTTVPARVLELGPGVVAPGARADLIAFRAGGVPQVIVERQAPVLVVARGTVAIDRHGAAAGGPPP
ncbi:MULTISPECIES: amidohydrolase [Methylobacterium]|uniref:Amidohydrolase n=1 Tax=Methylobacterium oryzae CBMB20 TaxID=693986 RepID=A0A089NZ91_9HYPH|nr:MULTISPECIES: amidohydrolase [Methylobacterium]AIQ93286.1 Amidohydrolase [Methylobacterium oryzae CBMB20]AWV15412.1 cytosine deaminase [Methylobacterium sp. XJLW]WFS07015.1 amidohydrolase [Methylobacterium sp. 391_Methyba4]